jgi:signal transduction histidine kinase/ligand-binding sensor domain-containing protein
VEDEGHAVIQQEGRLRKRLMPGLVLAAALLASPWPVAAVDRPVQIAQYAHTSWPRNSINMGLIFAMAQTPDGYLWIGGSYGLFRFDGVRFVKWEPPNGESMESAPYALLVARDGTLWIGTFYNLYSWDGHKLTEYPELHRQFVSSLLEDGDGTIWAGTYANPGRLCAVRAGQVRCSAPEGGFGGFVWSMGKDGSGNMWLESDTGAWRWSPGTPKRYDMKGLRAGDITTTVDGKILFGIAGGGLRQVEGDHLVPFPIRSVAKPDEWLADREVGSNKLLSDRDGGLWIGTESRGLIHVKDGKTDVFTRADGLTGNITCSLFEDHEGNIWYGSDKGLDRFRRLPITTVSTRQGVPDDVTKSVLATTDSSLWVATNDGLARWKDGKLVVYRKRDGLPDSHVQSQYQDAEGRHWVSTARGLAYFAADRFVPVDGGPSTEVYSMTGDTAGNLWLAGNKGLAHLQRGRLVDNTPWSAFGHHGQAQVIVADRGGLWLSFWDREGILFFKDGKIEANYLATFGPGSVRVTGLRLDADGAMWIGTDGHGIARIQDGRIAMLSTANGLPCGQVHWSTLDRNGSMWMYATCGLVRVPRDDLAAWIADPRRRVAATMWDGADGVPPVATAEGYFNPPVTRAADGKLWFLSGAELLWVDPDHIPSNPVPPPVHVESLVADHRTYAARSGLRLPPLVRDIAIEYSALSLADPSSMHFRYRLEGHDNEWQEVVDRRLVTYTNLPPGNYRFRVKASNNTGVWNEEGAQLDFSILPAFYETAWFRTACVVMLIGLAWAVFHVRLRMRVRRLQREFEATLEARVAERTRIARDLHDTLLQRFHGLLLQFQAAFNLLPDRPRDSKEVLSRAIDQVAEAITEGRDTVQGLRASTQETNSLAEGLRALAEDLANENGTTTTARIDVQGRFQSLHPIVRDETFRIAGEALRNAFRHADARHIEVAISYDVREFRVRVRDDGRGIDAEVLDAGSRYGHFGLSGMRERAEVVGGILTVRSRADAGTEVDLCIPAARAYLRSPGARSWLPQKKVAPGDIGDIGD